MALEARPGLKRVEHISVWYTQKMRNVDLGLEEKLHQHSDLKLNGELDDGSPDVQEPYLDP